MFEPVTMTSNVVATGSPAVCGVGVGVSSCANAARSGQKMIVMIARVKRL